MCRTAQLLTAAGLLLACSGRSGTATDDGDETSSAGATTADASSMTSSTPTTGAALPTTGDATTTTTDPAEGCLGDAACAPVQCVASAEPVCTHCVPEYRMCASDLDCAPGQVCIESPFTCPCDSPFTTICTSPCQAPADCESGSTCDPASNTCMFDPCVGDVDCAPLFSCVAVLHGHACRRRGCESAADCGEAVCIDGRCHAAPGACVPDE